MLASIPAAVIAACKRSLAPPAAPEGETKVLTEAQWQAVEAATARIMPADHEPGAREANVVRYIDRQLARPEFASMAARTLEVGLRTMDRLAMQQEGKPFARCSAAVQDRVLRQMQQGVRIGRRDSKPFFGLLLSLTLEGFLCDPVYGGNQGEVGWKAFNIAIKPPRPRAPHQSLWG